MLKFLVYIFLAYMLYQLIFRFIIPVYRTSRKIKRGFREMQDRMQQQQARYEQQQAEQTPKKDIPGDYIDFEEVKE